MFRRRKASRSLVALAREEMDNRGRNVIDEMREQIVALREATADLRIAVEQVKEDAHTEAEQEQH